jgi:tetratricopeptide (TPR) repeat protein
MYKPVWRSGSHRPGARAAPIIRPARVLAIGAAAGLLAACGAMPMQASAPPVMARAPTSPQTANMGGMTAAAPTATPGLSARERFQMAVNLLQRGNAAQADVELKAYLMEVPNSAQAKALLAQIETPIGMLYPADNFPIVLEPNQTLSTLAGLYLGDVLQFYALARYNMIENPSVVSVGQTIKIPATPMALSTRDSQSMLASMPPPAIIAPGLSPSAPPPRPATPAGRRDPWAAVRAAVAAGLFGEAVSTAESARLRPSKAQAPLLAAAYAGNAKALSESDAKEAESQAVRAGQLYLDTADRPIDAVEPLALATMLDPTDMRAQTLLASAKMKAADIYYRQGVDAFQRQDLDGAIAAWDKAIAYNPEHKNAQLQRAQAIELKQNLQKLR